MPNATPRLETEPDPWAQRLRAAIGGRFQAVLPVREAVLATALLSGDARFSTADRARIRAAGLAHLVAVSGANVLFLLSVFRVIFYRCVRRRFSRWLVDGVGIGFIVVVTGAGASVLRAACMLLAFLAAPLVGRRASFPRLLLLAAWLLVLAEPRRLLFDAGFLLSCLACLGLWHAVRPQEEDRPFELLSLRTTWFAWAWTTPFQAWFFGTASWIGLIANAFVLFLIPWVQALAILALVFPVPPVVPLLRLCLAYVWLVVDVAGREPPVALVHPARLFCFMAFGYVALSLHLVHKRLSIWSPDVSVGIGANAWKRFNSLFYWLFLLPTIIDAAPDLVRESGFSMLSSSAQDG